MMHYPASASLANFLIDSMTPVIGVVQRLSRRRGLRSCPQQNQTYDISNPSSVDDSSVLPLQHWYLVSLRCAS